MNLAESAVRIGESNNNTRGVDIEHPKVRANITMFNVNSSDFWDNLDTPANIVWGDLGDVEIPSPLDEQIPFYNNTAGMWQARSPFEIVTDFNKTNIAFVNDTNDFEKDQFFNSRINFTNNTFLFYNETNGTVMLIANGILQQTWGESTYFPGKAEFANNLTVQGDTNLKGNTFFNNISGNDALIDSNLNVTGNVTSFANFFGGVFNGLFNWLINNDGTSTKWLQFNQSDLTYNESHFNASTNNLINETLSGNIEIGGNLTGTFFFVNSF